MFVKEMFMKFERSNHLKDCDTHNTATTKSWINAKESQMWHQSEVTWEQGPIMHTHADKKECGNMLLSHIWFDILYTTLCV